MNDELNLIALGYTGAIISAAGMLLLGIFGNFGIYTGAVGMMQQWHMFFSPSLTGIILGMIEGGIVGFVAMYAFALVYNKFV